MKSLREYLNVDHKEDLRGIPSYCTGNLLAIEALLLQEKDTGNPILIEATSNQVNQFGGYTGKQPADFAKNVYDIADKIGFDKDRIYLGGDHLGPLIWADEEEASVMEKAKDLVRLFVKAGYKKIHLDTSMRLGDDPRDQALSNETIARRGAELFQACEEAYEELKQEDPQAERPNYIIGSEVPIPGGAQEEEDSISVTSIQAVDETLDAYKKAFEDAGFDHAFDSLIGIVVQPGVEFGDDEIFQYDRAEAKELVDYIRGISGIAMEGHSTDYQPKERLKEMVEDGVAILKVGPALTFAMREGLFALSHIEEAMFAEEDRVNFPEVLEDAMLANPKNWEKHYHGSEEDQALKRKYSLSDRSRYYLSDDKVEDAIQALFNRFDNLDIPLGLLHQYMPIQYEKVLEGSLNTRGKDLVFDFIHNLADDYRYACFEA